MNFPYILIDLVTGNVISGFMSESDAWSELHHWASDDGLDAIRDLSLMRVQDEHPSLIAMEDDLVQRVSRALGAPPGAVAEHRGNAPRRAAS